MDALHYLWLPPGSITSFSFGMCEPELSNAPNGWLCHTSDFGAVAAPE